MNKSLLTKIDRFLAQKRKSKGGWAEVQPTDVPQLCGIIDALIEAKFDKDPDGDLPIEFTVVDRTRFEPMHFAPTPYLGLAQCGDLTPDQVQDIFDLHMMNLTIAHDRLNVAHNIIRHERTKTTEKR